MQFSIDERIKEHYNIALKLGESNNFEVLGIFLQGSQNYLLDYENSDIDSRAIILPSIESILLNKPLISTTYVCDNNEHIDLKDIRLMFDCFRKQNINFLEIMFSKYQIINNSYSSLFSRIIENRELIARYDNYAAINCMAGMAMEKYVALERIYPSTKEKIEKFGYDPKQLHHILRLKEFLKRYIAGEPFEECLISKNRFYLVNIKRGYYELEDARRIAKEAIESIQEIKRNYKENNLQKKEDKVDNILNVTLIQIMKKHLLYNI